eukprot:4644946-Prymnesium_polylepis.2
MSRLTCAGCRRAHRICDAMSVARSSCMPSYVAAARSMSPGKRTSLNSVPSPTKPGATVVTRMPLSYVSYRSDCIKACSACFEAQYTEPPSYVSSPAIDPVEMTCPPPLSIMAVRLDTRAHRSIDHREGTEAIGVQHLLPVFQVGPAHAILAAGEAG